MILSDPEEAPNRLAVEIEQFSLVPALGIVYVQDSQWRKATRGAVQLFEDEQGVLASAIVRLPESEDSPHLTLGITMHEIGHLLGLTHGDDPGSVMYSNPKVRPQILSDKDADILKRIYGGNTNL
jgi:predicted Zn-dependent protease